MPLLRLAYAAQFLIALIAVYTLWSQVGGQSHLDFMAWPLKLVLGAGTAFCAVKATAAAVGGERAWNGRTLRWLGILLLLLVCCGFASYYVHLYVEPEDNDEQDDNSAMLAPASRAPFSAVRTSRARAAGSSADQRCSRTRDPHWGPATGPR